MKAIICGAGIAGLAMAQRLQAIGWSVVIVEKAPGPRDQGYMIDFFGPGYEAAEEMGLLPRLRELAYQVEGLSYVDQNGRTRARLNYQRFTRSIDGGMISIMRPDLEMALRESMAEATDLRWGTSITAIDNSTDGVTVTLTDGSTVKGDLLIGADGIHSRVRSLVFGPEQDYLRHLGLHTAAYVFDDRSIHELVRGKFCLTDTIDKQIGFYGLRDGKVAAFTVHRSTDPTTPADSRAAIRQIYADLGWCAPKALAKCPDASQVYYDTVAQIKMPEWFDKRVVLIGDAGHAVSLLAGQGASLAIAGAYILGRRLARATNIDAALAEYQQRWHPVVTERQRIGRRGANWFLPHTRGQLWLRRQAVKAMSLPGLDRYLGTALVGKNHTSVGELAAGDN